MVWCGTSTGAPCCGDRADGPRLLSIAVSAPLTCPIRQRVVRTDPGNQKLASAERLVVFDGRRGLPVTKPRFLPAELAPQLARKLSARRLGTLSAF